jgi:hypothetical protein
MINFIYTRWQIAMTGSCSNHSLHTAIIDSQGKLVVNLAGNEYSAEQLGDLVPTVLDRPPEH